MVLLNQYLWIHFHAGLGLWRKHPLYLLPSQTTSSLDFDFVFVVSVKDWKLFY